MSFVWDTNNLNIRSGTSYREILHTKNGPVNINSKTHSRPRENHRALMIASRRAFSLVSFDSHLFSSGNHSKNQVKQRSENWQIWICCFIKANCKTIWFQNSFSFALKQWLNERLLIFMLPPNNRAQTSVIFWSNNNCVYPWRDSLKTHRFPSQKMPTLYWFRFQTYHIHYYSSEAIFILKTTSKSNVFD